MTQELSEMRISYPMELRQMDVSLATTLISAQRFGYNLVPSEASFRTMTIPTLIANVNQHAIGQTQATATFDGYYRVHLPMSTTFDQSLLLGRTFEWMQLEAIEKLPIEKNNGVKRQDMVLGESVMLDGVTVCEGNLIKLDEEGMMFFPACSSKEHGKFMIRMVFRPILARTQSTGGSLPSDHEAEAPPQPLNSSPHPLEESV